MAKRRGRGRPSFRVTPALQRRVEELVSCGMSEDDVARAIGCATETLRKHFPEELLTGRAKKRAEVIALLYRTARKGNVSAQKKLEELTGLASAAASFAEEPAPARPRKLGKKEQAAEAATTAGTGTEWGDDLKVPPTSLN